MSLVPGQTLSHYEIIAPLGAGAMGEVWRARDTRLGREVAVKVLPADLAHDEQRLRRFEREAVALAALNHPNVAGIHGIDQDGEVRFVAMELVPGEDLSARLERGPLALDEALEVCRQIAEGLEAAHEQGIVHRDLKPANIRVTPAGRAKILDFGLAKAVRQGSAPRGAADEGQPGLITETGVVLGTPMYMSPEQACGRTVDRRTDVWAFGCVLYECLTGRRAFGGGSVSDVLAAVLAGEPELVRLPARTPHGVRRLLRRCLDKDPRTRLQDVGEARIALSPSVVDEDVAVSRAGTSVPPWVGLTCGVLAVATVGMYALARGAPPSSPLDGATFRRLTDFPGNELDGAISPHGDFVAYLSDRDGAYDVWVTQIEGGEPLNLTQGRYGIRNDNIRNVGFTHGGSHVWFHHEPEVRLLSAPKTGGAFEPLLGPMVVNMDWTRDGSRIVYHTLEPGDPIYVRAVDDPQGDPVRVGEPGTHQHFPVWSEDEAWIFVVRGDVVPDDMDLWRMRPDGSRAEQLTWGLEHVGFPTPIDDGTVLFIAKDTRGAGPWIWALDLASGDARRATVGTERYTSLAASADGRRLVATVVNPKASLWRVPLGDETAGEDDATPLPGVPSLRGLAPRFAGGRLFYLSSRGAADGLWSLEDGRVREVWSGPKERAVLVPTVSPDGRRLAMARRRADRWALSVVELESGQTIRVFEDPIDVRGDAAWSPTGEWIAVGGIGPDGPGLFRFPSDGGPAETLVRGAALDPVWSPASDLIAYCGEQVGPYLPLRAVRGDGTPVLLPGGEHRVRVEGTCLRFTPDGSGLVSMSPSRPVIDFWRLDVDTGEVRRLTSLEDRGTVRSFDITPDGRFLVFDRIQENADVVQIELPERDGAL